MKNYVQKGEKLPVTAPVDVVSGNLVIVNDLHGIAITSGVAGTEITIATEGVFELPYEDNQAVLQGQRAYFREDTGVITKDPKHSVTDDQDTPEPEDDVTTEVHHFPIGVFVLPVQATDKKVQVKID